MADYYSSFSEEDEDLKIADLGMPIVDIPTATEENGHETRRLHESTDEFTSDEEEMTSTRNKLTGKRKKHQKPNMTPPEVQLESTEKRAKKYMKKKHVDRAMVNLIQCVALSRIVYGDGHWRLAESHANLAHGYLLLRDLPNQAYHHADIAKAILLSGVHTSNSADEKSALLYVLIKVYYVLGRSLTMQKKFTEAEQNLQKAEKISDERSRLPGIDEYEQADINIKISIALGKVCISQSKTAFGTSCFEKAIKLIQRNYGKDNVELIPVYQDLGRLELSKGKHANHERALEMYLQAHSIASAGYKGQSKEVAQSAHTLALAYAETGTEESEISAERYLDESLGIHQLVYGPHHQNTLQVQDDLCKLLLRTDRQEEAITILKTIIESKSACYGEMSEEVADAYKLFGSIRLSQGKMDKALKHFRKCHSIQTAMYGSNHKKPQNTQQTIDMLLQSPSLAAKNAQSKEEQLKHRPRFNATVGRATPLGGTKSSQF